MQGWWVLWLRQPKFAETHRFPHRIILLRRHKSFVITKQNTYIISSLLQGNEPLSRTAPTQRNKSVALKKYLGCSPPSTARQRAEQDFVPGQVRQNVFNPCGHSRERGVGKPCLQSCPVTLLEGGVSNRNQMTTMTLVVQIVLNTMFFVFERTAEFLRNSLQWLFWDRGTEIHSKTRFPLHEKLQTRVLHPVLCQTKPVSEFGHACTQQP